MKILILLNLMTFPSHYKTFLMNEYVTYSISYSARTNYQMASDSNLFTILLVFTYISDISGIF